MRHGVFVIVLENVRFAQVAIHRAHGIVSGIGGRLSVRLDSRIEIFQLQQAVAQLMVQHTPNRPGPSARWDLGAAWTYAWLAA